MNTDRNRVLFVCTGNAGRSPLAEAIFRGSLGADMHVSSAGVEPWEKAHPMACRLAQERGLDLTHHKPRHVREIRSEEVDVVVTIGDRADAEIQEFGAQARRIHWDIPDPADADGTPDSETVFRSTLKQIEDRLPALKEKVSRITPVDGIALQPAISTCCFLPKTFNPKEHLQLIAGAGFKAIELCCYRDKPPDFLWEDQSKVTELDKGARTEGVNIWSVHAPDRFNLSDADEARRLAQVDVLKRSVDVAEQLGAAVVVFHAGHRMPLDSSPEERRRRLDQSLMELADYASPSAVTLCLETLLAFEHQLPNQEVIERVLNGSSSAFSLVIDTGHSTIAGDLWGTASKAGPRLRSLHVQDIVEKKDSHILPGTGRIDWKRFMNELKGSGYNGPLMLEVSDPEGRSVQEYLAECWKSMEFLMSHL